MILKGKAYKFGNNINTDAIIPARYLNISDPKELAKHCFEDLLKTHREWPKGLSRYGGKKKKPGQIKKGDIILAGKNFGCGSSREHAPLAIKYSGISCVIAQSFARIFYRNSINIGLPILESPEAVKNAKSGDQLRINLKKGEIKNLTTKKKFTTKPFPKFIMKIIKAGGLIRLLKSEKP